MGPAEWMMEKMKNYRFKRNEAEGKEPTVTQVPGVDEVSKAKEAEDIIKKRKAEQEKALEYK